ncbi:MAG: nitrous oxide reductase accessory protein NosL, partial [Gammaproteobacteria bacterium]|nr:nitrous oxide reductase accessory protein NosL [Gammaproteobacteria bacterium]
MAFNKLVSVLFLSLVLLGCNSEDPKNIIIDPQAFESGDECHVCGMVISRFPGPKGQAFETRTEQMRKFCSTMEMMIWYLQPENQS